MELRPLELWPCFTAAAGHHMTLTCPTTQSFLQGLILVSKVWKALTALSGLLGAYALTLAATAQVVKGSIAAGGWPLVLASAAAAALAWAAVKLWDFRQERFINGADRWRKMGGYSLVKME